MLQQLLHSNDGKGNCVKLEKKDGHVEVGITVTFFFFLVCK